MISWNVALVIGFLSFSTMTNCAARVLTSCKKKSNGNRTRMQKYATAYHSWLLFEASIARNTTHTMVSTMPRAGDTIRVAFVLPWSVHCGPWRIVKRYVCAAKCSDIVRWPFEHACFVACRSPNATCVHPAHFGHRDKLRFVNPDPSRAAKRNVRNVFLFSHRFLVML